jgi:hypothetical protein
MTSKFDYLRHRPFLVIEHYTRPNGTAHTERKGWQKTGATKHDQPSLVYRISNTRMRTASVIIDLLNDRIIKNRQHQTMMFDDEALTYYKAKCAEIVEPAMAMYRP